MDLTSDCDAWGHSNLLFPVTVPKRGSPSLPTSSRLKKGRILLIADVPQTNISQGIEGNWKMRKDSSLFTEATGSKRDFPIFVSASDPESCCLCHVSLRQTPLTPWLSPCLNYRIPQLPSSPMVGRSLATGSSGKSLW